MAGLKIKNDLYRKKLFWLTKKWLEEKPIFLFWAQIFRVDYSLCNSKNSFRLLRSTLWSFIRTIIYVLFIVIIFEIYNYVWPIDNNIMENEAINALLTAIASVSGVFLGLYFTAVSGIASNFLLKATQDVRRHFLSTPVGEQYVQTVALTGILSIFYLVAKSYGYSIHPAGLIFLSVLGAYVIIRFWRVGSEVFYSLEPASSFPYITKNIFNYINGVTPVSFKWNKPAIQNHLKRLTSNSLELLNNLIDFGIRELKLSDEQLNIGLRYLGGLLFAYSDHKSKIPTNSFWYKTKNQFENWTLADSVNIALALNTGTTIAPKIIKDYTWFEEQVLDIVLNVFRFFSRENKRVAIFQGLEVFVEVAETYAKDFDETSIRLLFEKLETIEIGSDKGKPSKEVLAFFDTQGRLAISTVLGLAKYLKDEKASIIIEKINKISWLSQKSIYLSGLPFVIIPDLEVISKNLINEREIEESIVSPAWYIETLCVRAYLFGLQRYYNFIKSLHVSYFQLKFEKILRTEHLSAAVQLLQRWIEFTSKYEMLVSILKERVEELAVSHRVKDLSWPVFDFIVEEKTILDYRKEVVDKLVRLLPKLKDLETGDDLPDYFGQALAMGVEASYEACNDNDVERLKKTLPFVFSASLDAFEKISSKVKNWSQEDSKIVYSTEPLVNLLEISSYSYIYSELYQNPGLWEVAKSLWDGYLASIDAPKAIGFISAIVSYRDSLFMIMPQDTLRTKWAISFEGKMRESGFPMFPDHDSYSYVNGHIQPKHASPLIRTIARSGSLSIASSVEEIFFTVYLSKHTGSVGIKLPDKHDLRGHLEREKQMPTDK